MGLRHPVRLCWRKLIFLCQRVSITGCVLVGGGSFCPLPLSVLAPHLAGTCSGVVRLPQSLWIEMCVILVSGRHFLEVTHLLWPLQSFCFIFPIAPGALKEGLDEGTLFRTGCSLQSLSAWCPVVGLCGRPALWEALSAQCSHSLCAGFQMSQSLVGSSESGHW